MTTKKEVIRITVVGKQYNVGYFGIDFLQIPLALYLMPNYALNYFLALVFIRCVAIMFFLILIFNINIILR